MLEIAIICFIAMMSALIAVIRGIAMLARHMMGSGNSAVQAIAANAPSHCPSCGTSLAADISLSKYCGDCGTRCV